MAAYSLHRGCHDNDDDDPAARTLLAARERHLRLRAPARHLLRRRDADGLLRRRPHRSTPAWRSARTTPACTSPCTGRRRPGPSPGRSPGPVARPRRDGSSRSAGGTRCWAGCRRRHRGCGRRSSTRRTRRRPGRCCRPGARPGRWRSSGSALAAAHGAGFDLAGQRCHAFPTPRALLRRCPEFPGLPELELTRLHAVARAAARTGKLDVDRLVALGPEAAASRSCGSCPASGPFYASLVVVRACGLADVLVANEAIALDALTRRSTGLPAPPTPDRAGRAGRALATRSAPGRPSCFPRRPADRLTARLIRCA